jgi:hypothetical protein
MSDLNARKILAEFAGWSGIVVSEDKTRLFGTVPNKSVGPSQEIPHYESDPAACCSLLPKLIQLWHQQILDGGKAGLSEFEEALKRALRFGNDAEVCRLIVAAVREVAVKPADLHIVPAPATPEGDDAVERRKQEEDRFLG